jgi:hypothetical protein
MTAFEWQTLIYPRAMLPHVRKQLGARKLQLIACGLCRLIWEDLSPEWQSAVQAGERFAEGGDVGPEIAAPRPPAMPDDSPPLELQLQSYLVELVSAATEYGSAKNLERAVTYVRAYWEYRYRKRIDAEVCEVIREVAGNPFRVWTLNPSFLGGGLTTPDGQTLQRTDDVLTLANSIAESLDFGLLPILADAAEEMGLQDEELLAHLRQPGQHMRGCWALDLLRGRS